MNSIEQEAVILASSSKSLPKRFSLRCVLSSSSTKRRCSGLALTPPDSPCSSVSSADSSSLHTTRRGGQLLPVRSILKSSQTSSFENKESIATSNSSFSADATKSEPKRRRLFRGGESRQLSLQSIMQDKQQQQQQKSVHWQDKSKWTVVPACISDYRNVIDTDLWWSTKEFEVRKAQEVALVRGPHYLEHSPVPGASAAAEEEEHHHHHHHPAPKTTVTAIDYLRVCQTIYRSMQTEFQREQAEKGECVWTRQDFHLHCIRNSPNFSAGLLSGYRGMENGGFSNRRPLAKNFVKTIVEAHRDWLNHDEMTVAELATQKSRTDRYWARFMAQGDTEQIVCYTC